MIIHRTCSELHDVLKISALQDDGDDSAHTCSTTSDAPNLSCCWISASLKNTNLHGAPGEYRKDPGANIPRWMRFVSMVARHMPRVRASRSGRLLSTDVFGGFHFDRSVKDLDATPNVTLPHKRSCLAQMFQVQMHGSMVEISYAAFLLYAYSNSAICHRACPLRCRNVGLRIFATEVLQASSSATLR